MANQEEMEQTYEALKTILEDQNVFDNVVQEIFEQIDTDGNGNLEREEIKDYILKLCKEIGMKHHPNDRTMEEIFKDLDSQASN